MISIYINKKKYKVHASDNILQSCLSLGFDIPYFCWHPELGSIGACRQCAIKTYQNNQDTTGKLVMSCMTAPYEGMYISIIDDEIQHFRRSISELLMINHPHDCPVCKEGGSCHLQDVIVMNGQYNRKYRFTKRTHYNQYLGPFISHEMNRCITCYRCNRYYKDYAGGQDFGVYGIHDNIYFGRFCDGILENEFSGNLIDVCPTGVFTENTDPNRYNRKWDMQFAPSICQQCCIGCNISPGERYGELRRIENRYHGDINHYFLCDLGRFSYGYVNLINRPRQPLQRINGHFIPLNADQAIYKIAKKLRHSNKIIGIGSPRASIESNFSLRELVGKENFYTSMTHYEQDQLTLILNILQNSGIYTPSVREIESYDAILILGEDITQTGARIALAIRQAVKGKSLEIAKKNNIETWQAMAIMNIGQNSRYPLFITNVDCTRLDDISTWNYYAPVEDQARLGFAIAHVLDQEAPEVTNFNVELKEKIDIIAQSLSKAKKPLIISGTHSGSIEIIAAAANIALALKKINNNIGISFITSHANSMGISIIGGGSLDNALNVLEKENIDSLIVLENDLYRYASSIRIDAALQNVTNFIILDHQKTELQNKANFILSASSFAESSGTLINHECRAQRFFQVYDPSYYNNNIVMFASWRWLHFIHVAYLNCSIYWKSLDQIINSIITEFPILSGIKDAAPNADFRIRGQKLSRAPHCYSGRTSILSHIDIHEPRVSQDQDTMFTFSMEGNNIPKSPRQHIAYAWSPGWNSSHAWNKFQDKVGGNIYYGNPGIRLLQVNNTCLNYFDMIPLSFINKVKNNQWRIAPYWHLFGSEETSQYSPLIKKRMPELYMVMNYTDAITMGLQEYVLISFYCEGLKLCLPVKFSDRLSSGQIGLPLGLPNIPPMLIGKNVFNLKQVI